MDLKLKKHNLKLLYAMCLRELEVTRKNINLYTRKVKDSYIDVLSALENSYGTEDCLVGYDNTLTDLCHFSDALRKFNLKFELTPLFTHVTAIDDDVCDSTDAIFESAEESIKNVETKVAAFTYPQALYDNYTPDFTFDIIITYIKSGRELLFYVNDTNKSTYSNFIKELQNYFNDSPKLLDRIPEEGEVVGLQSEGYMFRIVRENGPITGQSFKAYLLDIGEVSTITEDMYKALYVLSASQQKYPSQALLCKLEEVDSGTATDYKRYLEEHLYGRHKLIVKQSTKHMLHVNFLNKETINPFKNTNLFNSIKNHEETLSKSMTNPFSQFSWTFSEHGNVKQQLGVTKQSNIKECVCNETYLKNVDSIIPNKMYNNIKSFTVKEYDNQLPTKYAGNKVETLTEEERRMLYEEALSTTNAMKAVMGYDPKDKKVICQFTGPDGNSCFKGAYCKFEHVKQLEDGWTRDQAKTIIGFPNEIVYPCNGQTITLCVTHIVNVELFFAHIVSTENRYKPTLNELIAKMNANENKPTYKKLKNLPARFELILAQYKDNLWYRAKVVNFIDNETLKIFYVDYGNSDILTLDRIRQWEQKFSYLPFQAMPCRIAGIKEIRNKAVEASEFLRSKLLVKNSYIKALVINNTDQLLVRLFVGSNDKDVSEELVKIGYAESVLFDQADHGQLLPA